MSLLRGCGIVVLAAGCGVGFANPSPGSSVDWLNGWSPSHSSVDVANLFCLDDDQDKPPMIIRYEKGKDNLKDKLTVRAQDVGVASLLTLVSNATGKHLIAGESLADVPKVTLDIKELCFDSFLSQVAEKAGVVFVHDHKDSYLVFRTTGTVKSGTVRSFVRLDNQAHLVVAAEDVALGQVYDRIGVAIGDAIQQKNLSPDIKKALCKFKLKDLFKQAMYNSGEVDLDGFKKEGVKGLSFDLVIDKEEDKMISALAKQGKAYAAALKLTTDAVVGFWPLTFRPTTVPIPDPSGISKGTGLFTSPATPEPSIVAPLRAIFPDLTIQSTTTGLYLKGPQKSVDAARLDLARFLDIPFPLVQVRTITLQSIVEGDSTAERAKATKQLSEVRDAIDAAHQRSDLVLGTLYQYIQLYKYSLTYNSDLGKKDDDVKKLNDKIRGLITSAGFDPDPVRPIGPVDALFYLSFMPPDVLPKVFHDAEIAISTGRKKHDPLYNFRFNHLRSLYGATDSISNRLSLDATQRGILQFFANIVKAKGGKLDDLYKDLAIGDQALSLADSSATVDKLLGIGMNALSSDAEAVSFKPLEAYLNGLAPKDSSARSGIFVSGNTSLAVTSGQAAAMAATADVFFPYRPQATLGLDDLTKFTNGNNSANDANKSTTTTTSTTSNDPTKTPAQTTTSSTTTASTQTTNLAPEIAAVLGTALSSMFVGITGPETVALLAALKDEPTVYQKISPGISLGIRPTVLRDGASARIQVFMNVGADAENNGTQTAGSKNTIVPPYDLMRSHAIQTDFAVTAFDFKELSSIEMTIGGRGDNSFRVPILSALPAVGSWFVGPRAGIEKHVISMIVMNVVIVPRSLDLVSRNMGY